MKLLNVCDSDSTSMFEDCPNNELLEFAQKEILINTEFPIKGGVDDSLIGCKRENSKNKK